MVVVSPLYVSDPTLDALPLDAEDLWFSYGAREVLRGVSLRVGPGEVVGLLGRNGSGKSTLLACLLGLAAPTQGVARVFGCHAGALEDAQKARLAYVPQRPEVALGAWATPDDALAFWGSLYPAWDAARTRALMARWDVDGRARIARLSPGELQRLALVRALATRPGLLVLDEPVSALDPAGRRQLLQELAILAAGDGTAVVFSTHIVSDLERFASRVALLHAHRLVLDSETDALKTGLRVLYSEAPPVSCLPGELARAPRENGGAQGVVAVGSPAGQAWGADGEAVTLEELFLALTESDGPRLPA